MVKFVCKDGSTIETYFRRVAKNYNGFFESCSLSFAFIFTFISFKKCGTNGTYTHFNNPFFFFSPHLLLLAKQNLFCIYVLIVAQKTPSCNEYAIHFEKIFKYHSIDPLWFFSKVRPNGIGTVVTEAHTLSISF